MGYYVILIDEKDNAVMLDIEIRKGEDHQPESSGFAQGAFINIGVAIG